jgi:hypothetical protein
MAKPIRTSAALLVLLCGRPALAEEPPPAPAAATPKTDASKADAPSADAAKVTAPVSTDSGPSSPAEPAAWETAPPERRSGFTVGLLVSGGLGNITGYPADLEKRGNAAFKTDMGAAYGGNATLFLGGALTDWLVFGAGLGAAAYQGGGTNLTGFTFVFHTEVFPLYWLGGMWQELGVSFDTGTGAFTGELQDKPAGPAGELIAPVIESGAASRVTVSLFYDGLRLSKISAGPFVGFDYTWSSTYDQPVFQLGWRTALYVKAPKKK